MLEMSEIFKSLESMMFLMFLDALRLKEFSSLKSGLLSLVLEPCETQDVWDYAIVILMNVLVY